MVPRLRRHVALYRPLALAALAVTRCPRCYRRVDPDLLHVHICASAVRRQPAPRQPTTRYWRPSRAHIPRADYLAAIAVTAEQKRAKANARQRAYKARQKAKAAS